MVAPRLVTPDPLNVAPALIGRPLATPQRRALAMGVDLLVVTLLSGVSGFWLAGGLVLVALQLRSERGAGQGVRAVAGWMLVVLFVALAAREAWQAWHEPPAPPQAVLSEVDADDVDEAVRTLSEQGLSTAASAVERQLRAVRSARAASAASAARPALTAEQRIAQLEAQLAEARKPQPFSVRTELRRLLDALGASFGWAVVYFSLLPAFWNGQTLGKRLFKLQVVELTGRPMTVMRCLRRYGGYAAGMATGGLGFAQALWDVNGQGIQDRTAHTVVIDLRQPTAAPPPSA